MFLLCACMCVCVFPWCYLYIWVACWIFFFFSISRASLWFTILSTKTLELGLLHKCFHFFPPSRFQVCFNYLALIKLLVTYLFSVEMFWSLLQVLIPSSSLTPSTSGECGIVDKSSWQHSKSNHFPPDVRVWEGTKREWKEGGIWGEKPDAATASSTHIHDVTYSSLPETPNTISFTPLCWKISSPFSFSVLHILPSYTPGGSWGRLCLLLR